MNKIDEYKKKLKRSQLIFLLLGIPIIGCLITSLFFTGLAIYLFLLQLTMFIIAYRAAKKCIQYRVRIEYFNKEKEDDRKTGKTVEKVQSPENNHSEIYN